MPGLLPDVDREGLLEYSVVYTDRSINHMSQLFQGVMRDISGSLKKSTTRKRPLWSPAAEHSAWKPLRGNSRRTRSV